MRKRFLIIYHRIDYDGLCSMAVTKRYLSQTYPDSYIEIYGFNYGDTILNLNEVLEQFDMIFLVDISFPAAEMMLLANSGKAAWIDHHITQITESQECGFDKMPGIRVDGTAACELCWKFFFPDIEVPLGVKYLSHYDTWKHDTYSWDDEILPYQYGLRAEFSLNAQKFYDKFEHVLREVESIKENGKAVLNYLYSAWKGTVKGYAFDVTIAGKYKGVCMLTNTFGSSQFDSVKDRYEVFVCVNRKGPDLYNFSMYVNEGCDFNAGEHMKKFYGGGGHAKSSGGKLNLQQFIHLVHDCEID